LNSHKADGKECARLVRRRAGGFIALTEPSYH
jgi:hypothetical protein